MNAICHEWIARGAVAALQGEAADYWNPETELLAEASNFPDLFAPGEFSSPDALRKHPDWMDYILIPTPGGRKNFHTFFNPLELMETYPPVLAWLIPQILNAMQNGERKRAAKFAGILSHLIGDTGQPAHDFDPSLLAALFQNEGGVYLIHTFLENTPPVHPPEQFRIPVILGDSAKELQWRMLQKLAVLKKHACLKIVPILTDLLAGNLSRAAIPASESIAECADLLASFLQTLFSIHEGECGKEETIRLEEMEPADWFCDGMFNGLPQINRIPGRDPSHSLPLDLGSGAEKGIALLPNLFPGFEGRRSAFAEYLLPPGVFRRITFRCGLNRAAERNETNAVFELFLDGKLRWSSPETGIGTPPVPADIPLDNAERLRIQVSDCRENAIETKFFYPCILTPELHKE